MAVSRAVRSVEAESIRNPEDILAAAVALSLSVCAPVSLHSLGSVGKKKGGAARNVCRITSRSLKLLFRPDTPKTTHLVILTTPPPVNLTYRSPV